MPVQRSAGDPIPAGDEVVSRVFGAPRGLVFEVWTKAEHFTRWFGPHGAEVFSCEIDARPGGVIRFGHRFPDGMALRLKGTFVEVVLDERLVFTLGVVDEHGHPVRHPMFPDWPLDVSIETTVTLEDVGDGTRVTVAHRVFPGIPFRMIVVPVTHDLIHQATVDTARLPLRLLDEVAEERGAWRKLHMVDVAVQGLVHSEHELGHAHFLSLRGTSARF